MCLSMFRENNVGLLQIMPERRRFTYPGSLIAPDSVWYAGMVEEERCGVDARTNVSQRDPLGRLNNSVDLSNKAIKLIDL